ncbi:MAG TPA: serine/threonine-protein kinase, partial [Candidatus Xenobia bacterium]
NPALEEALVALLVVAAAAAWRFWPRFRRWRDQARHDQQLLQTILQHKPPAAQGELTITTGQTLIGQNGSYVLLRLLGKGGMGAVYEAAATGLVDRQVAVKVIQHGGWDDEDLQRRFLREFQACRNLNHPAIVKVLDWGVCAAETRSAPFMAMELLSGRTLHHVYHEAGGPVPPARVVRWLLETLQGLRIAHQAGIIHRDIKPDNLMLTESRHIKIMDFGIAHQHDQALTKSNVAMGTPLYMSPEHVNAQKVGPESDIYSLGMVGYELLCGRHPLEDNKNDWAWNILARILTEPVPHLHTLNPNIPDGLALVIMKMVEKDRKDRYQTAPDATAALIACGVPAET